VDRIHTKKKIHKNILIKNQTTGGRNGPLHPPKKKVTAIAETVKMLAYSAIKNNENFMLLYSVWYPATNSVSASGKSNGHLFTSAMALIAYTINPIG
jgi:hypothetical protein